jgi:hypothetical protein
LGLLHREIGRGVRSLRWVVGPLSTRCGGAWPFLCRGLPDWRTAKFRAWVAQRERQLTLKLLWRGPPAGRASPLPKVTEWVPTGAVDVGTRAAVLAPRQCESVGFATPRRTTAVLCAKPVHVDLVTISSEVWSQRVKRPFRSRPAPRSRASSARPESVCGDAIKCVRRDRVCRRLTDPSCRDT